MQCPTAGGSMLWNIIDRRKRPYRWKSVTAIIEPVYHDNSIADADEAEVLPPGFSPYDQIEQTSVAEAMI
jgi:hypothetical protein